MDRSNARPAKYFTERIEADTYAFVIIWIAEKDNGALLDDLAWILPTIDFVVIHFG
jgi:hypothetical protein